jgi:LuxR family transcriptional regulator, maltose regulon positive regulatory protein
MLELKLRPPTLRPGMVARRSILERIRSASDVRLVTMAAPAGYGKTSVLAQLHDVEERPCAWLAFDHSENDPAILLGSLTEAMVAGGLIGPGVLDRPPASSELVLTHGIHNLIGAAEEGAGGVLFLDQLDSLRSRGSLDVIGALINLAPAGFQTVIATRSTAGLPISLLRSQGGVLELSMSDLAMDEFETAELLESVGVSLDFGLDDLVQRTEGWPAGIYLTALAFKAGAPGHTAVDVRGDDIFLADYLREEVLGRLSRSRMTFLMRTSILPRLSGPLCDHLLQSQGSAGILTKLEESNLLVVPMDHNRGWYRYHSLLQDFLQAELERREPQLVASLHSRAATWFDENGHAELAIEHARAAGEGERFALMVSKAARVTYARGRMDTLAGWLDWLENTGTIAAFRDLAATGALARSLEGDVGGAERLAAYAFTSVDDEPLAEDSLGPAALLLRSFQAQRGMEQSLIDARAARLGFARSADWLHVAIGAEALALTCLGERDAADGVWADAVRSSESLEARPFTSAALTYRGLIEIGRDDWESAHVLIDRALELVRAGGLDLYITSALTFALASRVRARRGDVEAARSMMGKAAAIRPRLTAAIPGLAMSTQLEMARGLIELADMAGARRMMREASDILATRPRLGVLGAEHDELKATLALLPAGAVGPSSLTKAELRLLPLLVTHLTYPEIGERLYISRHTVKTQAMSIYRKLGVSSRTDAVEKARSSGLLSL